MAKKEGSGDVPLIGVDSMEPATWQGHSHEERQETEAPGEEYLLSALITEELGPH